MILLLVVVVVAVDDDIFVALPGVLTVFPYKTFPQCQFSELPSQRALIIYFKQL